MNTTLSIAPVILDKPRQRHRSGIHRRAPEPSDGSRGKPQDDGVSLFGVVVMGSGLAASRRPGMTAVPLTKFHPAPPNTRR